MPKNNSNQYSFEFGVINQIEALHLGHNSGVAITDHVNRETGKRLSMGAFGRFIDEVKQSALELQGYEDIFIAQNAVIPFERRCLTSITHLTALWVDLDYTKDPSMAHLSYEEFAEKVFQENPWLPLPTFAGSSGQNAFMVWAFNKPIYIGAKSKRRTQDLAQWSLTIGRIVELLKPYQADPACTDPARFLRLVDTVHSKSGNTVKAKTYGSGISFRLMNKIIKDEFDSAFPASSDNVETIPEANLIKTKKVATYEYTPPPQAFNKPYRAPTAKQLNVLRRSNFFTLAHGRMQEIRALTEGRINQGCRKLTHGRWQYLYCYSVEAARFCRSEDSLIAECNDFAQKYFDMTDRKYAPENMAKRISSVLKRFHASIDDIGVFLKGVQDQRIKHKRETVVKRLEITNKEAMAFGLYKIAPYDTWRAKKNETERDRTRKLGVKPQAEESQRRKDEAADNAQKARELKAQGLTQIAIAKALGVTDRTVRTYLR